MQPWVAERAIDAELARALLDEQFPELASAPLAPFGEGWDNAAFLVGELVFRFPRRAVAVPLLERECRVLPSLQALPLAIPDPRWLGRPSARFDWPFAGYRRLPGRSACGAGRDTRARIAAPLGRFLAALHAIEPAPLALGGDDIGRLAVAHKGPQARERAAWLGLELDSILDVPPPSAGRPRVVVHSDLYARHLLIDRGALSGIIDWGDVHLGDPAVDLAVGWSFFAAAERPLFVAAYGAVDDETWRLARFRAASHSLAIVDYAAAVGDAELLVESRRALDHLTAA